MGGGSAARVRRARRARAGCCAGALMLCLGAAGPVAAGTAPDETVFDFGTVERGTQVEHTFRLPNRGGGELRIENVKSSCGCAVGVASAREIPPGGEGRVTVRLDTARMAGRATKVVSVYTNDPAAPVVSLALAGQVLADLVVTPSTLYLGRLKRGEPVRREALITPGRPGATYAVTSVDPADPALHVTLEPAAGGSGQRLVVELDRKVPLGRISDQLTLHTTSPREPVMTLAVFGSVEGDLVVLPPEVTFGASRNGGSLERELVIHNRGARPVSVTRIAVPSDIVAYQLSKDGREYRVTLRLRDHVPPGGVRGAVEIFTDHPDEGHLVVPIRDARRRG